MTTAAPIPPITGTVTIAVPIEQAFRVFTGSINSWWPVEVEHRHFDRLDGGQGIHDAIRGGGGWALLLDGFAKTVVDQP